MASRKPVSSHASKNKRMAAPLRAISRRTGKTIKAAVDDFLLDRQSQNYSPQTLRWHTIALEHFVTFLEQEHQMFYLQDLEAVYIRAWLVFLEKEVGPRGKVRVVSELRTRRWTSRVQRFSNSVR